MAESPKFAHLEGNQGRGTRAMHPAIIIGIVRSLIVDVAMGQIPRSTERISSFLSVHIARFMLCVLYLLYFVYFIVIPPCNSLRLSY